MAESASGPSGPFRQIVHLILVVLIILYLAKIYLRDPEYRHVEVCYMPYKVAHLAWVDAWGAVVTDDTASLLKHSRDLGHFFNVCSEEVSTWTLLRTLAVPQ
ncbi:hypothetical protein [Pseudomonas syringae]|uniref:hypothetical protein n=1 Tax=Pseudomonas syringae TaxID=317 RepID=UPI001F314579|nr:hypothetical protein [Pseudomonas syringae]MCF5374476.1 hypothetical protein [Pseudomonas syringae]MCF5381961.1 hypothetical protein [Pseudomonas syringae]MCF5419507.1 hypothetical protein [Pseudomonas syringae]MCF5454721.1 hypothetical protein [Pseudomonas syringae]MCF5460641.1 hypothetical protein [Pseudomonas syringae]